ncbi:MAG TPA: universal stress protein [Gemmatimonadales bacterium]
MSWNPIIIGVEASPEAAQAAVFGCRLAQATATTCHLVHAMPDPWITGAEIGVPPDIDRLREPFAERARAEIADALRDAGMTDPPDVQIRFGGSTRVLAEMASERHAGLVVLGGKRHAALQRWLGGSTAHSAARAVPVPLLVTRGHVHEPRRVLVAVDLSGAAKPTLRAAERLAGIWDAELRVVTVLEPLPTVPGAVVPQWMEFSALWEETLKRDVWSLVRRPRAQTIMRHGAVMEVLRREVAEWRADLLVVGSHGKGWVDRMILGSMTERLLNELPTSLVVVPAAAALAPLGAAATPEPARAVRK